MYRLRLAIIAVAGDLALMVLNSAGALPIVIGALWMNVVTFYWLSGAAILLFAWMVRPSFRFSDRELAPEEAPRPSEGTRRLKEKLRVRGRMQVCLDESFNASAAESRGIFGLLGTRSALTLGVPLLFVLDRRQVLAIIGHEFGHFSRRHGRLGNWLYRARVGWMMYAEQVADSDSSLTRPRRGTPGISFPSSALAASFIPASASTRRTRTRPLVWQRVVATASPASWCSTASGPRCYRAG